MISETKIIARYAETDKMGIVHHSVYPVWYEVARTEGIKKIGISYSEMEKLGIMTPLSELNCKYIAVSYNNTYNSKSSSSRNKITLEELERVLSKRGTVRRFEKAHQAFNAGKTELNNHKEFLFLVKVGE